MSVNDGDPTDSKRRLRLMPEVLPDPTPHHGEGAPRQRTVAHLQRLMALTAALSASAACTKEGEPSARKEDESSFKRKSDSTATTATTTIATTDTTATATATAPSATVTSIGTGYAVVDPLPPPAVCPGLAATIGASASWKTDKSGAYVELRMPKSSRADVKLKRTEAPTAYSAKVASVAWVGDDMVLRVVPDAGATMAYVYVAAECSKGGEHVYAQLDLSGGAKPGSSVTVTLNDSY